MSTNTAVDVEHRTISYDNNYISFITAGNPSNPPVIFIHGWTSYAGLWMSTINALKSTHYCVAVDLLGHGASDKPRGGDYSIDSQARRVLAVADSLSLSRFTLIGHSMGGQISLYLAAVLAPNRVIRLIDVAGVVSAKLANAFRFRELPAFWMGSFFPAIWSVARFATPRFPWYREYFDSDRFYIKPHRFTDAHEMALIPGIENAAYPALKAIAACPLNDHLSQIKVPTLIIFGEYDRMVPVSDGQLAAQKIAGSKLVLMKDCGHCPMLEYPDQFISEVKAFLS